MPAPKFPTSDIQIESGETLDLLSRGRMSNSGTFTSELQIARVDFVELVVCKGLGVLGGLIPSGVMCLGGDGAALCTGGKTTALSLAYVS